jgi:hypothetical protein
MTVQNVGINLQWANPLNEEAMSLLQECRLAAYGWAGVGLGYDIVHQGNVLGVIHQMGDRWEVLLPKDVDTLYSTEQEAALTALVVFLFDYRSQAEHDAKVAMDNMAAAGLQAAVVS